MWMIITIITLFQLYSMLSKFNLSSYDWCVVALNIVLAMISIVSRSYTLLLISFIPMALGLLSHNNLSVILGVSDTLRFFTLSLLMIICRHITNYYLKREVIFKVHTRMLIMFIISVVCSGYIGQITMSLLSDLLLSSSVVEYYIQNNLIISLTVIMILFVSIKFLCDYCSDECDV